MEQDALRLIVRRKLAQSDLPHDSIPRFWGGPATDEACDACEETIGRDQFTVPSSESPGGTVVVRIDRFPNRVPSSAIDAVTFAAKAAMGAVLLSRVQGLDALRVLLRKLNLTGAAAETACAILTERQFHEIDGVTLTPRLIRELSV